MPNAALLIEPLLAALGEASPSGPALDFDPQFEALEQAGAGKPERQYGNTVYPAEPPDWPTVWALALPLAERSRDLRVAVWLLRSGAHLHGLAGVERGLQLVLGLLERLWDSVHPQLDISDGNDPTMRLNALAPLVATDAVLADVRAATLTASRGSLTMRDLELGLSRADPAANEIVPTEAGVLQALQAMLAQHPDLAQTLDTAHRTAAEIATLVERQVGAAGAQDFSPLVHLLRLAADGLAKLKPKAAGGAETGLTPKPGLLHDDAGVSTPSHVAAEGALRNRADVVRELGRICDWIERNEPSNPAPLLIRRAQRLINKSFVDIIRDLAPESLAQIEHIAGPDASV